MSKFLWCLLITADFGLLVTHHHHHNSFLVPLVSADDSSTVTGVPFAGRLTHVTTASENGSNLSTVFHALGLTAGPFPNGWPPRNLPPPVPNGSTYTSIGFWLGNTIVEVLDWKGNTGNPNSWIAFEPASDTIANTLNVTLPERGFNVTIDSTYDNYGTLLFTRYAVNDFPSADTSSLVQYTYTPAYSFLPLDYTTSAMEPQGTTLGLLKIELVEWNTLETNLSEAADAWSNLLNVPWENCPGEATPSRCFPPTSSYGMSGPRFAVLDGVREGLETLHATVASLNLTAQTLAKVLGDDKINADILNAGMRVDLGGVFFQFREDPGWMGYFGYECQNTTFAAEWPIQCNYALYGTTESQSTSAGAAGLRSRNQCYGLWKWMWPTAVMFLWGHYGSL